MLNLALYHAHHHATHFKFYPKTLGVYLGTLYFFVFLHVLTIFEGSTDLEHIQIIHKVGSKLRLNKGHSLSCLSHERTPWMSFVTKIIAVNSSKGIRGKCI
jgi:hypothetical protein